MTAIATKPNPSPTRKRWSLSDVSEATAKPDRYLVYGIEGVGKSTLAAGAPSPIAMSPDSGARIKGLKFLPTPETWDEVFESLSVLDEPHPYKTLIIDPVNWLELLCFARVVGGPGARYDADTDSAIIGWGGGFSKGYKATVSHWRTFVSAIERHWARGMTVVFCAHSKVKGFNDPAAAGWDRYQINMYEESAGVLKQWCDYVLFARHEAAGKLDDKKRVKGISTGQRVMHTQWNAAWDAKSREKLPEEVPLSWTELQAAIKAAQDKVAELKTQVQALVERIGDSEVARKATRFVVDANDNPDRLAEIVNALAVKLNEKESTK